MALLSPMELEAVRLSLLFAGGAVLLICVPGVAIGYLLARRQFLGKSAVETLINFSLVLPPVVTGYLLLVVFGRRGLVGRWLYQWFDVSIAFTGWAAVIAAAVVSFPLFVRSVRLAFQGVDARLEQAARSLGAGPLDAFLTVSLPLARHGVIAGFVLAFARSLGEFGATVVFAGNSAGETQTMALAIFALAEQPGGLEASWKLVTLSVLIAAAALAGSEWLERRGGRHESA